MLLRIDENKTTNIEPTTRLEFKEDPYKKYVMFGTTTVFTPICPIRVEWWVCRDFHFLCFHRNYTTLWRFSSARVVISLQYLEGQLYFNLMMQSDFNGPEKLLNI